MITYPDYAIRPTNFIQGPALVFYAPYVANGADPATGNIIPLGSIDKAGVEFDHKLTLADVESDAFTAAVATFLTKQEFDLKFNLQEMSNANLRFLIGAQASALVVGGGVSTLSLGEPFDVLSASSNPSMRPPNFCMMIRFPSAGHDNSTSPIGAWGYLQLFNCYVQSHGAIKFAKDTLTMANVVVRALTDVSVSGPSRVGKLIQQ